MVQGILKPGGGHSVVVTALVQLPERRFAYGHLPVAQSHDTSLADLQTQVLLCHGRDRIQHAPPLYGKRECQFPHSVTVSDLDRTARRKKRSGGRQEFLDQRLTPGLEYAVAVLHRKGLLLEQEQVGAGG